MSYDSALPTTPYLIQNMKTFKEFVQCMSEDISSQPSGNYVAVNCDLSQILSVLPKDLCTGIVVPNKEAHITLMYSTETSVDPSKILPVVAKVLPNSLTSSTKSVSVFDMQKDPGLKCIVLELNCTALNEANEELKKLGLVHSFPSYSPHTTLFYDVPIAEAAAVAAKIQDLVPAGTRVKILPETVKAEPIDKDFSSKLK